MCSVTIDSVNLAGPQCPVIGPNNILDVSVKAFLDEIYILITVFKQSRLLYPIN